MSIVLAIPFVLVFSVRYSQNRQWLRATFESACLFSALTVLGCELLSLFSAYTFLWLAGYWVVVSVVIFLLFKKTIGTAVSSGIKKFRQLRKSRIFPILKWQERVCVIVMAVFALGTFALALLYPPTMVFDAATYHMPRVFFWMKNASVHNYPTVVARQLYTAPMAGYFVLQLQVLNFGSDALAGLVQWGAYIGSIAGVYGIAQLLGAPRKPALMAALLASVMPIAVVQAPTTQNDLLAAFWCVVTVYFVVWYIKNLPKRTDSLVWAVFTGLAGGAAALTKHSSYLALAPFAVMFVIFVVRKVKVKHLLAVSCITLGLVLFMNSGYYIRNAIDLDGDFMALNMPEVPRFKFNLRDGASVLAMNTARNLTSNKIFLSSAVNNGIEGINAALGTEMDAGNRESSQLLFGIPFNAYSTLLTSPDDAPNPIHFILYSISAVIIVLGIIFSSQKRDGVLLLYVVSCFLSQAIISVSVFYMASITRYLIPPMLLSLAFVPFAFGGNGFRRAVLSLATCFAVLYSVPCLLFNSAMPLSDNPALRADLNITVFGSTHRQNSRRTLRFHALTLGNPDDTDEFFARLAHTGAKNIGYSGGYGYSEYPWLYPLRDSAYEVRYINALYHSSDESSDFVPDAIIAMRTWEEDDIFILEYNSVIYYCDFYCRSALDEQVYMLMLPAP